MVVAAGDKGSGDDDIGGRGCGGTAARIKVLARGETAAAETSSGIGDSGGGSGGSDVSGGS